jgi:subtilisin family serine protease
MLLRTLTLLIGTAILLPATGFSETFVSQGRKRAIEVEKGYRVVEANSQTMAQQASQKSLPKAFLGLYSEIGYLVLPVDAVTAQTRIVGVPLWFNREKAAAGILTKEIVVMIETAEALKKIRTISNVIQIEELKIKNGLFLVRLNTEMEALDWSNKISGFEGVRFSHPNFLIAKNVRNASSITEPLDPFFPLQWHLKNSGQLGGTTGADIHVLEAWAVTKGSDEVLIAVLDSGFEMGHPDLQSAWATNYGETAGNGVDDDNNGFIDDVRGWNFQKNSADVNDGFSSPHGTSVVGLLAARHNGNGISGVCPNCLVLPLTIPFDVVKEAAAFYYAKSMGAQIISNSWGYAVGTPLTDVVVDAINDVALNGREGKGTVILFAMNNINQDDCLGPEPDISALDSVIAVSSSSDLDKKTTNSAWGDCMEFIAPSHESMRSAITTTDMVGTKGYNNGVKPGDLADLAYTNNFGGSSAATPIAAGVFGLMFSINQNLTRDEALSMVLATADKVHPELANYDASGFSRKYGFGRINAAKALRAVEVFRKYSNKPKSIQGAPVRRQ